MTEKIMTEEEQLAFFDGVLERFERARSAAGTHQRDYRIAGTTVRLCFAGESLVSYYTPAFEHLASAPVDAPDTTLYLWDSRSTGITMLPPPCDQESFTDRGDIWGFHSQRIKTAFHYHDYSVNLFDRQRRTGIHWVNNADALPYWDSASPIRTLLHWHMEGHGLQLLHAAAVGTDDGALLITGKGGVGKSSTALECLRAGFHYVGDDYVVIRHSPEPAVYCLYSTAKLNPGDLDRFPELRPFLGRPDPKPHEKAVLFLHPRFRDQIRLEMPLEAIAIPQIEAQDGTEFVAEAPHAVQHAASFTTMSQLPYVGRHTHDFLGALCAALPGYRIRLGRDRGRIPAAIGDLMREHPRRARAAARSRTPVIDLPRAPLVSVVMPVWNGERFLREAVDNVLSQGYPALEIIIVDDGSTDGTEAEVRRLPCDVRYFKQENAGPAAARNRGIRDTSGDLIAFLDVDDLWPENNLRLLVGELLEHPELDLVHGYGQLLQQDPVTGTYEYAGNPKEAFPYYIGAGLYRRRVFDRLGLFDRTLRFGEDADWYTRAREQRIAMRRLDVVTLLVRRHSQNMTQDRKEIDLSMLRVFKKALDRKRAEGAAPG
jgi:hypothetical protein